MIRIMIAAGLVAVLSNSAFLLVSLVTLANDPIQKVVGWAAFIGCLFGAVALLSVWFEWIKRWIHRRET